MDFLTNNLVQPGEGDNLKDFFSLHVIQTQKLQMVHLNHKVNIMLHMTNPCETTQWAESISEGTF